MRNAILGTVAGLVLGTAGALAYSHYLGDGQLLADLQAKLDAANASLAKAAQEKQLLAKENSSVSDQVDHLLAANGELKHQLDSAQKPATPDATPAINLKAFAGMMQGGRQGQQRMFLLQSRLHLTADQATAIKAAMDADAKTRREVMQQMFRDGKVDPQAAAKANTLDQTLATVLAPEQKAAYQQVQADEKTSRADTSATVQVNQMAPLLQLSDSQKEQVASALYQIQMAAPDPTSLLSNPNAASLVTAQAQATQDAMAKVLTPDQMALYQQSGVAYAASGPGGRRGPGGGGNGGNAAPAANTSGGGTMINYGTPVTGYATPPGGGPSVLTTVTPPQVVNTASGQTIISGSTSTNDAGSTNSPAATTNAAPAQ